MICIHLGALILTNDGDFVYRITHPKHEISKAYVVTIANNITDEEIGALRNGVIIDDNYKTKNADVNVISRNENQSKISITIHEGKNRQIRKMCEAIDKKVVALNRTKIGDIDIRNLEIGKWRYLSQNEVEELKK